MKLKKVENIYKVLVQKNSVIYVFMQEINLILMIMTIQKIGVTMTLETQILIII